MSKVISNPTDSVSRTVRMACASSTRPGEDDETFPSQEQRKTQANMDQRLRLLAFWSISSATPMAFEEIS